MPSPDPNAPYSVEELRELDEWLVREFKWRKGDREWFYEGPCARCGHGVDKRFVEETLFAFREAGSADAELRTMRCNCAAEHEGAEGNEGCGAYWGLAITPKGDTK